MVCRTSQGSIVNSGLNLILVRNHQQLTSEMRFKVDVFWRLKGGVCLDFGSVVEKQFVFAKCLGLCLAQQVCYCI